MKIIRIVLIMLLMIVMIIGCKSKITNEKNEYNRKEQEISNNLNKEEGLLAKVDINKLITAYGDIENSEYIIINVQGGPVTTLDDDIMLELFDMAIDLNKYSYVNVHQIQTYYPEKFNNKEITFEEAKSYDKESAKVLGEIIKALKNKYPEKKVVVYGYSFGALMVQEVIAEYGSDIADKFAIVVGRLDMNEEFVDLFSNGFNGRFDSNQKIIKVEDKTIEEKNMNRLAAGLGFNRYTEKLKKIDLSNVIYIYAAKDSYVGKLKKDELKFLKSKNVKILEFYADHSETIDGTIKEAMEFLGVKTK